ncbi:MAG TPA: hypothetical protein VGE93_04685 [Bryobacteraceae bacterium]
MQSVKRWIPIHRVLCYLVLTALFSGLALRAQTTPIISGGGGMFVSRNGGQNSYFPVISPLAAVPLGDHVLVETRATLLESFTANGHGYDTSHYAALTYLQGDFLVSPHLTVVAGSYLTPFGTYNERLTPIWISNFQNGPLILPLGTMASSGTGGMVRGSAVSRSSFSIDYAAYFSARSGNEQFLAQRSSGGRLSVYLPKQRLELGTSYGRLLQGQQANFQGVHLWWEPANTGLRFRSEYAHGAHSSGYWFEAEMRPIFWGGENSWVGRFQPAFRMQQTFRNKPDSSDGLPGVNTRLADFGLAYNLPHEVRLRASYSRQFSNAGDKNIWTANMTYRFLFPAWKGKK